MEASLRFIFDSLWSTIQNILEGEEEHHSQNCENNLLFALSKVQQYLEIDDHKRKLEILYENHREAISSKPPCYLQRTLKLLVIMLASDSDFIGHSAGKAILALSHHLSQVVFPWAFVVRTLWEVAKVWCSGKDSDCFSGAMENSFSIKGTHFIRCDICSSLYLVNSQAFPLPKRKKVAMARIIRLLRAILKRCKQREVGCVEIYLEEFSPSLILVSLESTIISHQSLEEQILLGSILQLISSLLCRFGVEGRESDGVRGLNHFTGLLESFLPTIAEFTFAPCAGCNGCICSFLQHKVLRIFYRMSHGFKDQPVFTLMCFEVLSLDRKSLLCNATLKNEKYLQGLEDSPFRSSMVGIGIAPPTKSLPPGRHLQRLAVLLVFKAVLSLIHSSGATDTSSSHLSPTNQDTWGESMDSHGVRAGVWLVNWMLTELNSVGVVSSQNFDALVDEFVVLLLQLFLDEDDLLLEMLLQLFDFSRLFTFLLEQDTGNKLSVDHISVLIEALKPVRIFPVFLSQVGYDHTVIVDYLISQDTGTLCLQYLLQCLRALCDSWPEFQQLTSDRRINVAKSANCLMLLKSTIARLQKKKLFPYNASALIRRLEHFQKLWQLQC